MSRHGHLMRAAAGNSDPVDAYWANVVFMQNWDTVTPDATGKTVTLIGNASVSGGSLIVDGAGAQETYDCASVSIAEGLGNGNFALDMVITLPTPLGKNGQIIAGTAGWISPGTWFFTFNHEGSSKLALYDAAVSTTNPVALSSALTFPANAPTHVQLSRTSGVIEAHVGGVRVFSAANTTNFNYPTIKLGAFTWAGMAGSQQASRITKGSNRGYTGATITVPTLPYPEG